LRSCASASDETFVDQCLSLTLLHFMMLSLGFVELTHIPGPLVILPLFAARLLWRLASGTLEQVSSAPVPA
jgi:alpha-1,2-mannosyltransferase